MSIAPIVRTTETRAAPARAFELFTGHMGRWWPPKMTIGAKSPIAIVIEPRVGGAWYEQDADGTRTPWGKVLAWDPPGRLLLAWQIDSGFKYAPDLVTELEITFAPSDTGGTFVRLEHRNLERLGTDAPRIAEMLRNGWPTLMDLYARYSAEHA